MQGMTPSAHRRAQMERGRRKREADELAERTKLKCATARHTMALRNDRWLLAGARSSIRPWARRSPPASTGYTSSALRASRWARSISASSALLAASAVCKAAGGDEEVVVWTRWLGARRPLPCAAAASGTCRQRRHRLGAEPDRGEEEAQQHQVMPYLNLATSGVFAVRLA